VSTDEAKNDESIEANLRNNEVVNNSNLEQLQQREYEQKTTKTGGNKRTTVRKKSMRCRGRTISKN